MKGYKAKGHKAKQKKTRIKANEDVKNAMFLRGSKASDLVMAAMHDLMAIKKPNVRTLRGRNHNLRPFEEAGQQSLSFLCEKNDSSLFCVASHSKKRPHNLVMGRTYNWGILDMFELGIADYVATEAFKTKEQPLLGSKPALIFIGSEFEYNPDMANLKNFFADFFRGFVASTINVAGVDHAIVCTAKGDKVYFRHYFVSLAAKGDEFEPEMVEIGPRINFKLRRTFGAPLDVKKASMKMPKQLKEKKRKNVSRNEFDDKIGRIHVGRQNLDSLVLHKGKGLRKRRPTEEAAGEDEAESFRPRTE